MRRVLHAMRRFAGLSAADRRIAFEAMLLGAPVEASLRTVGLKRTQAWLDRLLPLVRRDEAPTAQPAELEKLIGAVLRRTPLHGACLQLALVQVVLERRRGHAVQMAIGVRSTSDTGFAAHAWVEPLDAPDDHPEFKRLWTWIPGARR